MPQKQIYLLCFIFFFMLSGCGFHLRGSQAEYDQLAIKISPILLKGISQKSPYYNVFKRAYRNYQIILTTDKKEANALLLINRLVFKQHILMVDNRNKAAEYETRLEISFTFRTKNSKELNKQLIINRSYLVSDTDVLGKHFERDELRKKMVQEATQQILGFIFNKLNTNP